MTFIPQALNSPPLVASLGSTALLSFPKLESFVSDGALSWNAIRILNLASYLLHAFAVSVPGRIDGENAKKLAEGDQTTSDDAQDKSLVIPSGWAFAIWGVIFAGELAFTTTQFLVPENSTVASVIKDLSVPFSMAQAFQVLWCAAFRPKYEGNLLYISSALLGGIAYSLSKAHKVFTSAPSSAFSFRQYLLYFLPMTLHFGWVSAATLVNLNGAVARGDGVSAKSLSGLGHASAVAATAAGVGICLKRSAPVYGGVISWALFAISDAMKKRVIAAKDRGDDFDKPGLLGARVQKTLTAVGAWASIATSVFVSYTLSPLAPGDKTEVSP